MSIPVIIPLLNPNEPEARLVAIHVREGQHITRGEALCTLETTKSANELVAEQDGYVVGLQRKTGQTVQAGDILCYLTEQATWKPPSHETARTPEAQTVSTPAEATASLPEGLRITQPALALALQSGLDLSQLPKDRLVTESMVRQLSHQPTIFFSSPESAFDPTAIIVYGGGGHGKSLIDLLQVLGTYQVVGVIDDGLPAGEMVLDVPVLGGAEMLPELYARGVRLAVNAVGGIGNVVVRVQVFQRLAQAGFVCPALVHPTAFVEASANLAAGVQVFPQAYVGSAAQVGFGSIINTGAIISHDCVIGDYVNISPGAVLAGNVHIGSGTLIGMLATVNLNVKIGAGARIGNGATVKEDVPENGLVRAGAVWPG